MATFLTAAFLGFSGSVILGNLLNWPDAGAILAIAFVGGRIVKVLRQTRNTQEEPDDKTFD